MYQVHLVLVDILEMVDVVGHLALEEAVVVPQSADLEQQLQVCLDLEGLVVLQVVVMEEMV